VSSDYVATADALRSRLQDNFSALPIYYQNDDREPTLENAPDGFVVAHVNLSDERQISLGLEGNRLHRDFGELSVYVYVPRNTRVGAAETYAEQIRALFKTTSVANVVVTRRTIGRGGEVSRNDGQSRAYCVPLFVEFFADRLE
jgi:hypothetical protein